MFNRCLTMLAVISGLSMFLAIAGMGPAADAGCIPLSSGGQYCASWIVGSTEAQGHAKGLGRLDCTDKKGDPIVCPGMSAEMWGTIQDTSQGALACDKTTLDNDCLISVLAICGPKKCANNPNLQGCSDPTNFNSAHFSKSDVPVQKEVFDNCTHNGSCKGLIDVLTAAGEICQGNGHVLINAAATEFNGQGCFCLGGFAPVDLNPDSPEVCCADGTRDGNGLCIGDPVAEECAPAEFCEVDVANAAPGDPYNCSLPLGGPLPVL